MIHGKESIILSFPLERGNVIYMEKDNEKSLN